ncbi:MAG TPA: TfoX/Sxy family protein [Candidatus Anaerofilum excrementigallinarum]|nr:TfoX/Sxy family protein [Candidatus Anaerofilum excrementigallinarum]
MASHADFVDYVADQMQQAGVIRSRRMFGEYGLYCDGVFFAVICGDQLFVKITPAGQAAFPDLPKAPPYEGARDYFLVEDVEDREQLAKLVRVTCEALKNLPQKKRRK